MENKNIYIDEELADTIIERPYAFEISGRPFYLYPVTLGKSYLISRLLESLDVSEENINTNPFLEAIRVCRDKRDIVIRLLVYHTIRSKKKLFDYRFVESRCKFFDENLDVEDIANLLIMVIGYDKTQKFIKHLGIDKELEWKRKVSSIKDENDGTVSFGGVSVYGTLINFACERYGWSYEYVLWGISLVNLKMLMNDCVSTIYLSKEERKKIKIPKDRTVISGDSRENIAKMKKFFKD